MSLSVSAETGQAVFKPNRRFLATDLLFVPLFVYMIFYVWLRPYGVGGIVPPLLAAALICITSRKILYIPTYLPFIIFSTAILVLSLCGLMPKSWTTHFDSFAALRHFAPLFLLPILATAFFVFFLRFGPLIKKNALNILITLASIHVCIGALAMLQGAPLAGGVGSIYTLTNNTMPLVVVLIIFLFREKTSIFVRLIGSLAFLLTASSAQTFLVAVLFTALSIIAKRKLILLSTLAFVFAFLVSAPLFPRELHQFDVNSGVRAVFWGDVWRLIAETKGLGVGFGTEYITNQFYILKSTDWGIDNFDSDYLFIGTHSTFYDMLLRVGIIGFGLFLYWFLAVMFPQNRIPQENAGIMFYAAAIVLVVSNAVNVGIYSINFLFGSAMALGFMESLRATVGHKTVRTAHRGNSKASLHAHTPSS